MNRILLTFGLIVFSFAAFAQKPVDGNPLLNRMLNYKVTFKEHKYDVVDFPLSNVELTSVTGEKSFVHCSFDKESRARKPNTEQILINYYDIVRRLGGRSVYKGDNYASFQIKSNEKFFWVVLQVYSQGQDYTIAVIEEERLLEDIVAEKMLNTIKEQGHVPVYISFASGSADLSRNTDKAITEIVKLLRMAPKLNISIEGHTDNVGTADMNKQLSVERAKSVQEALVRKGIDPARLTATGWGQEKPIAPNEDEKGRLKNRRVELVKSN